MDGAAAFHEEERLGKAYDARLMRRLIAYVKPYKGLAAAAVALIVLSSVLQLVGPLATAVALDLYMRPPAEQGAAPDHSISAAGRWFQQLPRRPGRPPVTDRRHRPRRPDLPGGPPAHLRRALRPVVPDADDGAEDHVRPPARGLRPLPATAGRLLRQEPDRPAGDPGDHRRRRPERAVHRRAGVDLRRRGAAGRHRLGAVLARLEARAGHLRHPAAAAGADPLVQGPGAPELPRGAGADRADQRLPPGAHHRHAGAPAVQPGGAGVRASSPRSTATTGTPTCGRSSTTRSTSRRSS